MFLDHFWIIFWWRSFADQCPDTQRGPEAASRGWRLKESDYEGKLCEREYTAYHLRSVLQVSSPFCQTLNELWKGLLPLECWYHLFEYWM